MALGLCETLWLRLLLQDLGYLSRQPIRLFCDNKATCDIAHNPVQHDRTKHVEVDRFFIKEKLDDKIVELPKIRSEDQMIDILAKVVSTKIDYFERLRPEELYQQNIEALVAENNLERIKERSVHSKETPQFMSGAQSLENITSKGTAETGSAVSFSDDEDLSQLSGSKSTTKGRSSSSATFKYSHDASEHGKDVQLREMSSFALGRLA
ncbi:hypothetical protein VitviT2T_010307 [Vitis vinifera]|uniref:Copia protein n=1 Tax=Vitis vinifera TaxID=29760 RepID=A0ABY9C9U3_VITVI|nr:hypothetical protein VitviT2T_010307 [Vitis vinifera]